MAKKNVSEIERGVGYFMGLATGLMNIVRERETPFEAIYRLATPRGRATLEKMVDVAFADWSAEQPKSVLQTGSPYRGGPSGPLPPDHYRLRVNRGPLPSFAELEIEFGKGNVSSLFDGRPWTKSKERFENDVIVEEVVILAKDFAEEIESGEIAVYGEGNNRYILSDDIVTWGIKHEYTPCEEKETYAFSHDPQTRDLQHKRWHVALGSSALGGDRRCVARLSANDRDRIFNGTWYGDRWHVSLRFLFARKF